MFLEVAAKTDVGLERDHNEDSFLLLETQNIFVVCDGMGGHQAGDFASQSVVKVLNYWLNEKSDCDLSEVVQDIDTELSSFGKRLISAVRLANRYIYSIALNSSQKSGMGTTLALIGFEDSQAHILHVGDSRIYRFLDNRLDQLTLDHSWVNELLQDKEITEKQAENFDQKNVITRALGTKYGVKIDYKIIPAVNGSQFLICSDGLTGPVKDEQITEIIGQNPTNPEETVNRLIEAANRNGGPDNITAVLLRVNNELQPNPEKIDPDAITMQEEPIDIQKSEDKLLFKHFGKQVRPRKSQSQKTIFLIISLILIVVIILYFMNLQYNKTGDEISRETVVTEQPAVVTDNESVKTGKIVFIWFDVDKRKEAFVFIDREMKGTVENFRTDGFNLDPGSHQIQVKLKGKTVYNQIQNIKRNEVVVINMEELLQK